MARLTASNASDNVLAAGVAGNTGTISIWINPSWSSGDGAQHFLFSSGAAGTANDVPSFQHFSDNNIYAGFGVGGGGNARIIIADTGLFTSGAWANWALTWSVAAGQTLYKNAVSRGTSPYISFSNTNTGFYIGGNNANGSLFGSFAHFARWDVILSAGELAALSNGALPYQIRTVKQWLPIDGLQSPEPDFSGNANNGTVTGASLASGPPVMMFTPRWPLNTIATAAPSTTVFRRTLSSIGTRTGSRQVVA